ncbi:MAG: hypothetical protein ACLFS3_00010 [Candidatus Aenigmatarchaeota archaeon]
MNLNSNKSRFVVLVLILFAVTVVSGCTGGEPTDTNGAPENGGEENTSPEISSVDATWVGYEGGEFDKGMRIRARNMDTEDHDWRIESTGEDYVVIYNSDETAMYITQAGEEKWTKITGSLVEQAGKDSMEDMIRTTESWAENYGEGTHDVNYGEESMEAEMELNPSLDDDLFLPPEDAEVEEPSAGF